MGDEHEIQNQIRLAIGEKQAAVMFRANVGTGWTGTLASHSGNRVTLTNARRFSTGLPKGFPDLFGFRRIKITPDMVGHDIAVFAFIEVKGKNGKPSESQKHIHRFMSENGAIGGIARSPDEALKILEQMP